VSALIYGLFFGFGPYQWLAPGDAAVLYGLAVLAAAGFIFAVESVGERLGVNR
jgi:hypothetical protein